MKRLLPAIVLGAASAFACSCAVQGRPFKRVPTPARDAVIYVYRPYNFAGCLLRPEVTCGGEKARIGPGGYHAFVVPAGHSVVCSTQEETTDRVEIDAEPRAYYIREEFGWGLLRGHPHLNPMDTDTAQTEIQKCCVLEQP
jgi:hypothetical protein